MICGILGTYWMVCGVAFSGHATLPWFTLVSVAALALMVWTISGIRAARTLSFSAEDMEHSRAVLKLFFIDLAIELGAIFAGYLVLNHIRRWDLIPQVFGVVIGLHFLPLKKVFRFPLYYWTGVVMVAGTLGSLLIARGGIRNFAGCAAVGLTLWATSVVTLWESPGVLAGGPA
jgi:hypothetical protein